MYTYTTAEKLEIHKKTADVFFHYNVVTCLKFWKGAFCHVVGLVSKPPLFYSLVCVNIIPPPCIAVKWGRPENKAIVLSMD